MEFTVILLVFLVPHSLSDERATRSMFTLKKKRYKTRALERKVYQEAHHLPQLKLIKINVRVNIAKSVMKSIMADS